MPDPSHLSYAEMLKAFSMHRADTGLKPLPNYGRQLKPNDWVEDYMRKLPFGNHDHRVNKATSEWIKKEARRG